MNVRAQITMWLITIYNTILKPICVYDHLTDTACYILILTGLIMV